MTDSYKLIYLLNNQPALHCYCWHASEYNTANSECELLFCHEVQIMQILLIS